MTYIWIGILSVYLNLQFDNVLHMLFLFYFPDQNSIKFCIYQQKKLQSCYLVVGPLQSETKDAKESAKGHYFRKSQDATRR